MKTWQLIFTDSYNRRAARFLKRHPELQPSFRKLLLLLEVNSFHLSLRLQPRQGKLKGLHSVSINLSYRITIEFLVDDNRIIPIAVGDHDSVYR
jgi:mRNA-degrading endonuclease RelE of RelBE toxin-antitoxin system